MRSCEIIEHKSSLLKELVQFYSQLMTADQNYNNNRPGWCCGLVLQAVKQAENCDIFCIDLLNASLIFEEYERLRQVAELMPDVRTKIERKIIVGILRCTVVHLKFAGFVQFEKFNAPQFQNRFHEVALFDSLPETYKYFHRAGSLAYLERETETLYTKAWNYYVLHNIKYKAWKNAIQVVRDFVFDECIVSFQGITAEGLENYQAGYSGTRTATLLVELLEEVSGNSFLNYKPPSRQKAVKVDSGDEATYLTKSEMYKSFLRNVDGYQNLSVYKAKKNKIVTTECWSFNVEDIADEFSAMYTDSRYQCWNDALVDFSRSTVTEKSAKKNLERYLRFLAVYLYSYLPAFFESNNNLPYSFPYEIRDFHGFVYGTQQRTNLVDAFGEIPRLPIPFISLAELLVGAIGGKPETQRNTVRDIVAVVRRFFSYVRERFSAVPSCRILSLPISEFDKTPTGSGYSNSNKTKMDYEYWIKFKEFIYHLADHLITLAENDVAYSEILHVNKTIDVLGERMVIGHVNVDCFPKLKLRGETGDLLETNPWQQVLALCTVSCSGLRLSNVMWLDTDVFDEDTPLDLDAVNDREYLELYVNTDKSKVTGFDSLAECRVVRLLRRARSLKRKLPKDLHTKIPYQGNEASKWGEINPLLAYNKSNNFEGIRTELPLVLEQFQNCLKESGIVFESITEYVPATYSIEDKRRAIRIGEPAMLDIYVKYPEYPEIPFTPLNRRSEVTVHSLRKTFDSFMTILIGPELVGELFTGQTAAVVGSYTENTVVEELQVRSLAERSGMLSSVRVATATSLKSEDDVTLRTLKESGLAGIDGFVLSPLKGEDISVDQAVDQAKHTDIAINKTHICPYDNECPDHIKALLNAKKLCAICPVSIGVKGDGPAIAAKIKMIHDEILDINEKIERPKITDRETEEYKKERLALIEEISTWITRHKMLISVISKNDYVVLGDGFNELKKRIEYHEPGTSKYNLYERLVEVRDSPSLQSSRLIKVASRLTRKLAVLYNSNEVDIADDFEIDAAIALIDKLARTHNIEPAKIEGLIESQSDFDMNLRLVEVLDE